jgi:hypothetical protein
MFIYIYSYKFTSIHNIYTYIYMYLYISIYIYSEHASWQSNSHRSCSRRRIYIHICWFIYIKTWDLHKCMYLLISIHKYMYTYICLCIYIHIYCYIYIYIYLYPYTYIVNKPDGSRTLIGAVQGDVFICIFVDLYT